MTSSNEESGGPKGYLDEVEDTRIYSLYSACGESQNGTLNSIVAFNLVGFVSGTSDVTLVTIRLLSAFIPNVFNNVSGAMLQFRYQSSLTNVLVTLTIPNGRYDIYTLLTALQTSINGFTTFLDGSRLSSLLAFTYDYTTNAITLHLYAASSSAVMPRLIVYDMAFMEQLGFLIDDEITLFFSSTMTASNAPDLSGVTAALVQCYEIPTSNYSTELRTSMFAYIPIGCALGETQFYEFPYSSKFIIPSSSMMDKLTLSLNDQYGNPLDFRGTQWSMQFELAYRRNGYPIYEDMSTALSRVIQQVQSQIQNHERPPPHNETAAEQAQYQQLEAPRDIRLMLEEVREELAGHTHSNRHDDAQ